MNVAVVSSFDDEVDGAVPRPGATVHFAGPAVHLAAAPPFT
jgi:hypothetical protein